MSTNLLCVNDQLNEDSQQAPKIRVWIKKVLCQLQQARQRRRSLLLLKDLPQSRLKDLGLERWQVEQALTKPFWKK